MFPEGKGCVLTADDFLKAKQKQAQEKADKAAAKEQKARKREAARARNEAVEALWTTRKAEHQEALQNWEAQCAELQGAGVRKKDFPKRPVRPKHAEVAQDIE